MSQARVLFQLQDIELAVIERHKRMKEIDMLLDDNDIVQEAQSDFDAAQSKLDDIRTRVKNKEFEIETVTTKQKATESRLYSGNVKNPKELQDMQAEIESLTRRQKQLDDDLLELMVTRDEAQQSFDTAASDLESISADWEAEHQDLITEKAKLQAEADKLMEKRKTTLSTIDQSTMQTYNSLRKSKANRPVAKLEDKTCGICGIEQNAGIVSALNRDDDLVYCHNCGRILVRA